MSDSTKIEELFAEGLNKPAAERAAWLESCCAGDAELRARVEQLLAASDAADGILPEVPRVAASPVSESIGTTIDRYKLLEQIGEGGFGIVFMAEQTAPVRRLVALKIIKLGMDTKQVIARFEAERQALAMMDHPNVARVIDAGATDTGRPYFVMELVKGAPITDYCDANRVSIDARLKLFEQVCQAVQHAHQKGIIHRDLKPNNVLVATLDDNPVAKVIDFGIAKATQSRLTERTLFTEFRQWVGTPQYMSPEQADGTLDIDTRSDVYGLGVLLYELLTGTTPFEPTELREKAYDEVRRVIRDVEPPPPSTRLSHLETLPSIAATRQIDPRKLQSMIRGELDWIVMRCLEKDRKRRYETANALCRDIERFLADEPVQARPPTRAYRLWKFVRRNRMGVFAGFAVLTALLLGLIFASIGFSRARRHANRAEHVAQFLQDTLRAAGPEVARGRDATVLREVLQKTSNRIDQELSGEPEVQGDLWSTVGETYVDMGDCPRAILMFEHAVASYRVAFGDKNNPKLALALGRLGYAQCFAKDLTHGKTNAQRGLEMARACGDRKTLSACLTCVAYSFDGWGILRSDSVPYLREAAAIRRELAGDPVALADALRSLALVDDDADERLQREALALYRTHIAPDDPKLAGCLFMFGQQLIHHQKFEEAASVMRETVDLHRKLYDASHPHQLIALRLQIEALLYLGRWDEIDSSIRAVRATSPAQAGPLSEAVVAFRREWSAWAVRSAKAVEANPNDFWNIRNLAVSLLKLGRSEDCERRCHELLELSGWWKLAEAGQRLRTVDSDPYWRAVDATKLALVLPVKGDDLLHACEIADAMESPAPGEFDHSPVSLIKTLAELRRGHFESAIQRSDQIIASLFEEEQRQGAAWFIQAMACANLGRRDAAISAMAKGNGIMNEAPREDYVMRWLEWELAEQLQHEAAALLQVPQTHPATAPGRP